MTSVGIKDINTASLIRQIIIFTFLIFAFSCKNRDSLKNNILGNWKYEYSSGDAITHVKSDLIILNFNNNSYYTRNEDFEFIGNWKLKDSLIQIESKKLGDDIMNKHQYKIIKVSQDSLVLYDDFTNYHYSKLNNQ